VDRLRQEIERCVAAALAEDEATADATTKLLVPASMEGAAGIHAKAEGVLSGQDCVLEVFRQLGGEVSYKVKVPDGTAVSQGSVVGMIEGPLGQILSGERTALNFLCHLSGIATLTASFVQKVSGTGVRILDTRKTTPGMRALEKRAVAHGGGLNHRHDLASYILVKENHIAAAGGIGAALDSLGDFLPGCEIEVRDLEELKELSAAPPGRVMLDNFSPSHIRAAVKLVNSWDRRPEIEVSGGITLKNVKKHAIEGVDFISVGGLTASAPSLDLSLLVGDGYPGDDG
jgi:nicotinate-nucleotide pyrophosphorylase (carboxylating)